MKVLIELRPRLQVCHVILRLNEPISGKLSVEKHCISLRDHSISLKSIQLKPQSLSGFQILGNTISFRCHMEPVSSLTGSFAIEVLQSNITQEYLITNYEPKIEKNVLLKMICRCCEHCLSTSDIKLKRILPLPSSAFSSGDLFCHQHDCGDLEKKLSNPDVTDCFYGPFYMKINSNLLPGNSVVHCNKCLSWIGVKTYSSATVWNCTVYFKSNKAEEDTVSALNDFNSAIKVVINDSVGPICKIIVSCKITESSTHFLLLWVMDRNLKLLINSDVNVAIKDLSEITVVKVLYDHEVKVNNLVLSWQKEINTHTIEVAKQMFFEGLQSLVNSNKVFPQSDQVANGMRIGYLGL